MKLKIFSSILTAETCQAEQRRAASVSQTAKSVNEDFISRPACAAINLSLNKQSLNCPFFCQRLKLWWAILCLNWQTLTQKKHKNKKNIMFEASRKKTKQESNDVSEYLLESYTAAMKN